MNNLDKNGLFPNQLDPAENDAQECVALSISDICSNVDNLVYSPDFTYAMALHIKGSEPSTDGLDPYAAMLATVAYGLLPARSADFTARVMGELYIANWRNYAQDDVAEALKYARNGVIELRSYDEIAAHLLNKKQGVVLSLRWYPNFMSPYADGVLPVAKTTLPYTYHAVAVYGRDDRGLIFKPWLGKDWGDGGYGRIDRITFGQVFDCAFAFDPDANRKISLLWICLYQLRFILSILTARKPQGATL